MNRAGLVCFGVCAAAVAMLVSASTARSQDRSTVRDSHGIPRLELRPDATRPGTTVIQDSRLGLERGTITPDPTYIGPGQRGTVRDSHGLAKGTITTTK
jgi:hypothetical protein